MNFMNLCGTSNAVEFPAIAAIVEGSTLLTRRADVTRQQSGSAMRGNSRCWPRGQMKYDEVSYHKRMLFRYFPVSQTCLELDYTSGFGSRVRAKAEERVSDDVVPRGYWLVYRHSVIGMAAAVPHARSNAGQEPVQLWWHGHADRTAGTGRVLGRVLVLHLHGSHRRRCCFILGRVRSLDTRKAIAAGGADIGLPGCYCFVCTSWVIGSASRTDCPMS